MEPMSAGISVVSQGYRHPIPDFTPPLLGDLIWSCWDTDPQNRPQFSDIYPKMQKLAAEYGLDID